MNGIELLVGIAEQAIDHPEEYLRGGSNGPYVDKDTKVRCCAHWLITFSRCFHWTREDKFQAKVRELADFLCSREARPFGYSFDCRDRRNNRSNGLIGTAWVLEALAEATSSLGNPKYASIAREVAALYPFDEQRGLWKRLEVDGRVFPIECTFNHQLWFAACTSMLFESGDATHSEAEKLRLLVSTFLDKIEDNMFLHDNGMIGHLIQGTVISNERLSLRQRLSRLARDLARGRQPRRKWKYDRRTRFEQSAGYHAFNMYGFSLLRRQMPSHRFWRSPLVTSIGEHLLSDKHAENLESNRFGYAYNPIGFEVPFAVSSIAETDFANTVTFAESWINKQLCKHYNSRTMKMDRNTEDPVTLTARLYELARLEHELLSRVHVQSAP